MRRAGNGDRQKKEDGVGCIGVMPRPGRCSSRFRIWRLSKIRNDDRSIASRCRSAQRLGGRAGHASSQTKAIRRFSGKGGRHKDGCGNDMLCTPRKTKSRFPSTLPAFGNHRAIPTFPKPRRAVEKWKRNSSLPSFPLPLLCPLAPFENQNKKPGSAKGPVRTLLSAKPLRLFARRKG